VRVVDGDTIVVHIGTRTETVRYIGVNTPELHLELDVQERDRYGRLLAYVYVLHRDVIPWA